jgi:flagellar motor switch/type III secretory pathway protein FliN
MTDWLMSDDNYLGLDDPAMPDAAPTPPSAPTSSDAGGDWLGGASSGDEAWLGSAPQDAPAHGASSGGGVMDAQGDWLGDAAPAPSPQMMDAYMQPAATAPSADPYGGSAAPAPMAVGLGSDITVSAPMLEHVAPSPRALGGARSELSNLVLDVEVQVEVALGEAALTVEEFLEMGRGSVVELEVRGKLIARGQLVSINGSYGMRITEMLNEGN